MVDPVLPELGIVVHFSLCFPLQPFESATSLLWSLEWAFLFKYIQFQSSAARGHVISHLFFLSVPNRAWWLSVSWLNCTPNQPFFILCCPCKGTSSFVIWRVLARLVLILLRLFLHLTTNSPLRNAWSSAILLAPWHAGTFQIIFFPVFVVARSAFTRFCHPVMVWMRTDYHEVNHHFRVIALFHISKNLLRVCNSLNFSMSFNCVLTGELRDVIHLFAVHQSSFANKQNQRVNANRLPWGNSSFFVS